MHNGVTTVIRVTLAPIPVVVEELLVRGSGGSYLSGTQVIGRQAIDSSHARDLGELLDGSPGLQVIRTGGVGSSVTLSIRGSSPDEVLVLLDGTPVNDPLTGTADLSTIPLGTIERVTILRGVGSARYGAGALAGVVTLESRQAIGRQLAATAEAGTFGEAGLSGRLGGSTTLAGWVVSGLAVGEGRRSNGDFWYSVPEVRGGGDARRQNADSRIGTAFGTVSARSGISDVSARVEWLSVDRGMPGPVTQPTLTARQEQRRLGAIVGIGTPVAGWLLEVDAAFRRQEARYRDSAPPARPAYDDSVRVSEGTIRLQSSGTAGTGVLALGAEYRRQHFQVTTLGPNAPTRATYGGLWATVRHDVSLGSSRLELSAALRADRTTTIDGVYWSPRLGAAWTAGLFAVQVSWGQAFSPPTLSDQFFQEGVLVQANPGLGPERVRGEWQLGVAVNRLSVGSIEVDGSATVYRADVDGMILWQPDFRFVWSPHNFDVLRVGAELSLRLSHPSSRVWLHGSYSLTDVEYAGPVLSGQVVYRPRHGASLGLSAPYRWFRGSMDARFVGSRRTVAGSSLNMLSEYWMVDIGVSASFALGSWINEVFWKIENVFDERAGLLADYPLPSRGMRLGWGITH
jgi:outer membrane cobalamin receptor